MEPARQPKARCRPPFPISLTSVPAAVTRSMPSVASTVIWLVTLAVVLDGPLIADGEPIAPGGLSAGAIRPGGSGRALCGRSTGGCRRGRRLCLRRGHLHDQGRPGERSQAQVFSFASVV